MIDFVEFSLTEEGSKILDILEGFGEKFLIVAGNMASRSLKGRIFCKILSSLPQVKNGSYIPTRKRIFLAETETLRNYDTVISPNFEDISS